MRAFVAVSLLFAASPARAKPVLEGDVPFELAGMAESINDAWGYIQKIGQAPQGLKPPLIHFDLFDLARQEPGWGRWQSDWFKDHDEPFLDWLCTRQGREKFPEAASRCSDRVALGWWLSLHPQVRSEFPFPARFVAYYYLGTGRIQMNPGATFRRFAYTGPDGGRRDSVGYGAYTTGHEMLHYVLESRGVPAADHHCRFITPRPDHAGKSPMEELVEFLVSRGHATEILRRFGPDQEVAFNPCEKPAARLSSCF